MSRSNRPTRRAVLKAAGALIAAPYFVSAPALGRSGRTAASERLGIGIVGQGNIGNAHRHALLGNGDVQLVAVCDVDRNKLNAAGDHVDKHYGAAAGRGCARLHEYEALLARPDVDAVLVATPDHWHANIAIAACRAGKDVYCEKPLSLTVREGRAMVDAARRYGRVFQTGSQQRSSGNFRHACELVRNGRIGEVLTVNVGIGGPSQYKWLAAEPVPESLDWDRWLGPTPQVAYNPERASGSYGGGWRLIRDYSGGMMTDWGAHHFDIAQWGLGMDQSGPVEVTPPGVDQHATLTYRYANDVLMFHGGANGILFTGTEGRVEVNRGYLRTWPESLSASRIGPTETHLYDSPGHVTDWLECIRTRRRPICDVEIGCRTATVCHLGNIAWWLGRKLRWDPQGEQISGDDLANRLLDRPKRSPYFQPL